MFFLCSGVSSPADSCPALEQALCVVQFLQGISTWLGAPPPSPSLTLMLFFCCFSLLLFSFILFCGIFCPFLNTVSQRCCQFCWGAQQCLAVVLLEPAGPGAGQPLAFSHRSYSCSPFAAGTLPVITSTAGFSKIVATGIEIIMLPWRSQRCSPWIDCRLFGAVLKRSVFTSWVSLLEWNWEKTQVVRNKILEQFSLMKLCECSQLV